MDATDSLESWIAVKENPFDQEVGKVKLDFLVAWNDSVEKVVITCRDHSRVANDTESSGECGDFSISQLKAVHEQLCLIYPSLGPHLPDLPLHPEGFWAYLYTHESPSESFCNQLEQYLRIALDICGKSVLLSTLFGQCSYDDYFENISELKRRKYDDAVELAKEKFRSVLSVRSGSVNMLDKLQYYGLEDSALFGLNVALADLYNYLLQPFLDMREMSLLKLKEARSGLQNPNYGKRKKNEFAVMFSEWQENYEHALDVICQNYIDYYTEVVKIIKGTKKRMLEDRKLYGESTFEITALDRLQRITEDLHLERLQLLEHTKRQHEHNREKVKQKMVSLEEGAMGGKDISKFEREVYDWHLKVLAVEIELLNEEESLLKHKVAVKKLELTKQEEMEEFHDAVEELFECSSEEEDSKQKSQHPGAWGSDATILALKQKLNQVHKKKASLRNKWSRLERNKESEEKKKAEEVEKFSAHHKAQQKRKAREAETAERKDFLNSERTKTLERLKQYKLKYPSPKGINPVQRKKVKETKKSENQRPGDRLDGINEILEDPGAGFSGSGDCGGSASAADTILDLPSPPPPPSPIMSPPVPPPPPPPPPPIMSPPLPPPPPPLPPPQRSSVQQTTPSIPANASQLKPKTDVDPALQMMEMIKQGVKLKCVQHAEEGRSTHTPSHIQELEEALKRMKDKMNPSDDENSEDNESASSYE